MILPDLPELIQWFKDRMRPKNQDIGNGIYDWNITAEYVPDLKVKGESAYGALCSPGDKSIFPTQEDIEAKRAHLLICTPRSDEDIKEQRVTFYHECNHILQCMFANPGNGNRAAMENQTHSMDNFLSQLTPEDIALFARLKPSEMARAYRAKEGDMPDAIEPKKEPDKPTPAMQEGAPRDVAAIQGDIAKAALAGQPCDELCKELALALVAAGSAAGSTAAPVAPIEPTTMGMKPEEAYARGQKAAEAAGEKKLVDRFANTIKDLSNEQLAMVRRMPSLDDAEALVKTYPRQSAGQTMGVLPGKTPGKTTDEKPLARAMNAAKANPMVRKILGIGSLEHDGVHFEPGNGILIYTDGTEQLNHQRAKYQASQDKLRGAA